MDVIVGTPGRLLDLQRRGALKFNDLKCFILDETDQMLNQGFEKDIEDIIASVKNDLEHERKTLQDIQFLLFSATIPTWVKNVSQRIMKPDYDHVNMISRESNQCPSSVKHL